MNRTYLFVLTMTSTAVCSLALAQGAVTQAKSATEAKTAIDARQDLFKEIKKTYEPMTDMLKGKREFDSALVATNAAKIQEQVQKIPALFAVDTHQYKDTKTLARDSIWTNLPDYKARTDAVVAAAGNAVTVARTDNKGATMKAVADIGKSCGACHDNYKDKP